jgi:hypothetical protein
LYYYNLSASHVEGNSIRSCSSSITLVMKALIPSSDIAWVLHPFALFNNTVKVRILVRVSIFPPDLEAYDILNAIGMAPAMSGLS